jgi:lysophospholipase L1-like esterase
MKSFFWLGLVALGVFFTGGKATAANTNHNYARWDKEISAFERHDATNPPPQGACLFIGSSVIRFWKTLAVDFPDQKVINRGFGGSQIVDSTHFADRIIFPYAPRIIFLRAGDNDLAAGVPVDQVFADFKDFVTTIQARLPDTEIVYISLSPSIARWKIHEKELAANALIRDFIHGRPHLHYIDGYTAVLGPDGKPRPELFGKDKLHYNAVGYKMLTECIHNQWPQ